MGKSTNNDKNSHPDVPEQYRLPLRISQITHPNLHREISSIPTRHRSERARYLMELGLLYEKHSHLIGLVNQPGGSAEGFTREEDAESAPGDGIAKHNFL